MYGAITYNHFNKAILYSKLMFNYIYLLNNLNFNYFLICIIYVDFGLRDMSLLLVNSYFIYNYFSLTTSLLVTLINLTYHTSLLEKFQSTNKHLYNIWDNIGLRNLFTMTFDTSVSCILIFAVVSVFQLLFLKFA